MAALLFLLIVEGIELPLVTVVSDVAFHHTTGVVGEEPVARLAVLDNEIL